MKVFFFFKKRHNCGAHEEGRISIRPFLKMKVAASHAGKTHKSDALCTVNTSLTWKLSEVVHDQCFLPLSLSVYYRVNAMATTVLDSFFSHLVQHEAHFLEMSRYVNLIDACQAFRNEYFPSPWYKIHHITFPHHFFFPPTLSQQSSGTNTNAADSFHTEHSS